MTFSDNFFTAVADVANTIDKNQIELLAAQLAAVRTNKGRVFCLGIGGSAGNCSHMVNDLRKLCRIEAYCPTDNVSELTARTNDEGFSTIFDEYLKVSNFNENDCLFVLSVGGGNKEKNVSVAIVKAIDLALSVGAPVIGIVGKPDGYAATVGKHVVVVPTPNSGWVTPLSEAFQAVVWHCLVSHPSLQIVQTKW
jgi:D-sedoheptulose 7-phosphate isomerase